MRKGANRSSGNRVSLPPAWAYEGDLGRGGQSDVYRVRNKNTGEIGAFKQVRNAESDKAIRRARHEIYALQTISHPNLIRLLDHGENDGMPWCVTELGSGTLEDEHRWDDDPRGR